MRHVLRVIRELLYFTPRHKGTNLQKALSFLGQVQRRQVICFLISDFLTGDFSQQAALIAKRHELIGIHVYDNYETLFAPQALFTLHDLEAQKQAVVDTQDRAVQEHFKQIAQEHQLALKKLFERIGADLASMHTGESTADVLYRFFRLRGRKR